MITTVSKKFPFFLPLTALFMAMVLATTSQRVYAQQYKKITRLGTSQALCSGGVERKEGLQAFFAANPAIISSVLADSGWSGSADDLLAAVAKGEMIERSYPVGTQFAWMGAKVKGESVALPYRQWAGTKPLEAFQVNVSSDCQVYHLAIPKACCNVALISVAKDTSDECQPAVVAAPPSAIAPQPVAVAAVKKTAALTPYLGLFFGSETRPRFEPSWAMDMVDSSGVSGVRAGLTKAISNKTSVFGQLSYYDRNSINEGNIYPEDNLAIDVGFERRLSKSAFIGGGIGAWNVDDGDFRDTSLFGHVGADIGQSNFQWFLEGRVFDSDSLNHDGLSDNKMFSAGVRYLIK